MLRKFSEPAIILDHECYLKFNHSTLNNNGGYYITDFCMTQCVIKCNIKAIFEDNILLSVAEGPKDLCQTLNLNSVSFDNNICTRAFSVVLSSTSVELQRQWAEVVSNN